MAQTSKCLKTFQVFNAEQIEGIPPLVIEPRKPWEVIEAGENILATSGSDIRYGGDKAYYQRKDDYIRLPEKELFTDAAAFYSTAAHELGHWTGHEKRLNRPSLTDSYRFGDQKYALEELISELTSLYVSAETGLPPNPEQHAAYIASWVKALKEDKNAIFQASKETYKAADYILGLDKRKEQERGPHTERVSAQAQEQRRYR